MTHKYNLTKIKRLLSNSFLMGMLCCSPVVVWAQEDALKKADKEYEGKSYIDAIKVYRNVADSGYKSEELFKKLGNSYYFNAQYKEAAKGYDELFAMNQDLEPQYYLRYSQSLKASNREDEAQKWYTMYLNKSGNNEVSAEDYLNKIEKASGRYTMTPLNINTKNIEFGAGFLENNLVYASGHKNSGRRTLSTWDGLPYFNLYQAAIDQDFNLSQPKKIKGDFGKFYLCSAIFTKDGQTMYFTQSNVTPQKKGSKKQPLHLKIYRAHLKGGKWTNVEDLSINSDDFDTAHPALGIDESTLYFASNRPGTLGETDIYRVKINSNGSLGMPENIGNQVNTSGRESFPFISDRNELYFSSDGHFGLGGYDIFYVKPDEQGAYQSEIVNVGKPINSEGDDFAFCIKENKGFMSSNRKEGKGLDDIYGFVELKDIQDLTKIKVSGTIMDEEGKPVSGATVTLLNEKGEVVATTLTDSKGNYNVDTIDSSKAFITKVNKEGYDGNDAFSIKGKDAKLSFNLKKNTESVAKGDNIADLLNIAIYFGFDKSNIRPDAAVELAKIVEVMKQYPKMKIDVRSHTDCRQTAKYNMALSDRRAKSTIAWLVKNGISANRLTGRGYGESQLVNDCGCEPINNSNCTKEQHQANRRSEFIIMKL